MVRKLLPSLTLSLLLLLKTGSDAFVPSRESYVLSTGRLRMIKFGGGGGGTVSGTTTSAEPGFPRDVKEAVSKCRAAVQQALQKRLSRMDIEMPVGTKFGVEKSGSKNKKMVQNDGLPTLDQLQASDRELARIFVEMFQPLGGSHISVVFNDADMAEMAKKMWKGDPSASSCVLSLGRPKTKTLTKQKKPMGFAAKLAAEVEDEPSSGNSGGTFKLPEGTELALFVAPGPKELLVIDKICQEVGMGTLVILLNARLSSIENFGTDGAKSRFLNDFEPVFHLRAAPQDEAPGCLIHRAYPSDWLLARKPKVGQPKVILTRKECPSRDQCREAFENMKIGDLEKGVETVLDGVAGWFR